MNYAIIVGFVVFLILGVVGFGLARKSLGKLSTSIGSYYSFDLQTPKAGKWSVVFFLILLTFLLLVFALLAGREFVISPA